MTSFTRSMSVRISWNVCPTEMSEAAGDAKRWIKDCMARRPPVVRSPLTMSQTPAAIMDVSHSSLTSEGARP